MRAEARMRVTPWFIAIAWLVVAFPASAGPGALEDEGRPVTVPERPEPVQRPTRPRRQGAIGPERPERPRAEPPAPEPPPIEQLPGPMDRAAQRRFDQLRIEGIRLYEEGRYAEAADKFRAALRLKPNDPVARGWLRATERRH